MIALDTNILVYAHRTGLREHNAARQAIERAARSPQGWGFPPAVASEFWSVVTHPAAAGGPATPHQARGFIEALLRAGAFLMEPGRGFALRLLRLAEESSLGGRRIFDLQVALAAKESGATELWTHDLRFTPLPFLRLHDPLANPTSFDPRP